MSEAKKLFILTGVCGVGKSALCGTWAKDPEKTSVPRPPDGTPKLPDDVPSMSVDHRREKSSAERRDALLTEAAALDVPIVVVDVTPKQLSVWENLPGQARERGFSEIEIIVMAESEDEIRLRMLRRKSRFPEKMVNADSDIAKNLREQEKIVKKAKSKGWRIGTQSEIRDLIASEFATERL